MTKLPGLRAAMLSIAERQVAVKAQQLRNTIVEELSKPGTGKTYRSTQRWVKKQNALVTRRRAKAHTASAPGEAPAVDTGRLRQSIVANKLDPGHWQVGTNVEYALHLEYGTRKMSARPFMRPAFERVKD